MNQRVSRVISGALVLLLGLSHCVAPAEPENPVSCYAVNTGDRLTLIVYDNVCGRRYNNVRIGRHSEIRLTTCADEEGKADIRYRPEGYASRMGSWTYRRLDPGGQVLVQ